MKAPLRLVRPAGRALRHLQAVRRHSHLRAFGEELARVNLDLTPAERLAYLAWMREYARRKGVPRQPSYSVAWMLKVEREIAGDTGADGPGKYEEPEIDPPNQRA